MRREDEEEDVDSYRRKQEYTGLFLMFMGPWIVIIF
jgi:hypothetical protein